MKKENFNFIPFKRAKGEADARSPGDVTVNTKYGSITFSPSYLRDSGLEGKFIKFYVDVDKKALAWKVLEENSVEGLKDYRHVKKQKSGVCQLFIGSILKLYKFKDIMRFKGLKVKTNYPTYLEGTMCYVKLENGEKWDKEKEND